MKIWHIVPLLLLSLPLPLMAQPQDSIETAVHCDFRVRPQQIVLPVAMIAMGAAAISNHRLCEIKYNVRDAMQRGRDGRRKLNIETWATLTTQLVVISLGPKPRHSLANRLLVKGTSYALLYSAMPIVRRCVREPRPDGRNSHAFPSFKTANAFMAAEQARIERGWGWGMAMYTFATGVGVLQMYNDRCYINDVLAGAGMGILATHAAYWLLPAERRWFGLDKKRRDKDMGIIFVPTYEHETNTVGLAFTAQF